MTQRFSLITLASVGLGLLLMGPACGRSFIDYDQPPEGAGGGLAGGAGGLGSGGMGSGGISTGGTGLTGRDVTVEAHRDVYEKEMDAFGTVFTMVSMQKIGTSAVQSRATGGVANGTYLFALPGSTGACKDAWDEILVNQLDYRHMPCNFVEILPRLDEHQRRK